MKQKGFTLAEILITLTVIGIVAAISLPALMQNINERSWDTKSKALHSRMAAAISQIGDIGNYDKYGKDPDTNETLDASSENFITECLSKVYKIKNICDSESIDKCGISKTFNNYQGVSVNLPASQFSRKGAAFETTNGEKIALYYNPNCGLSTTRLCLNMIYDLNGPEGPNEMGKDMGFMSVITENSKDPEVVAPRPYYKSAGSAPSYSTEKNAAALCKAVGSNYTLPSVNELISITYNSGLSGFTQGISGTIAVSGKNGTVWFVSGGNPSVISKTEAKNVVCVKD